MDIWNMSWTTTELWRKGEGHEIPQFSFHLPVTGKAAKGESSSWELIPVSLTDLTEWALAFTTTGPFGSSENGWTDTGSNWWFYSVCCCGCGTQDGFAWKLIWKNENLATSPIQQMTLTVPERGRVHKQIRRSRAAPSLAAATLLILDEILSAYGLISYSFVSSGWGHTNPCQQHECQLKGLAAEGALEKTCFSVNSWLSLTADPNCSLYFSWGTLLHPDARFHDHY